jgi:hypothetical protein
MRFFNNLRDPECMAGVDGPFGWTMAIGRNENSHFMGCERFENLRGFAVWVGPVCFFLFK